MTKIWHNIWQSIIDAVEDLGFMDLINSWKFTLLREFIIFNLTFASTYLVLYVQSNTVKDKQFWKKKVLSMSFYPDFFQILSRFLKQLTLSKFSLEFILIFWKYLDKVRIKSLSWFYPSFIQIFLKLTLIQILSWFFWTKLG